ncbi:DUF4136 domain-containing protein [Novosphingobium cyanobacteriorum]|uniref:DUF4136 domain-containing protein n=1 Tax=Novosphingobium cyanobacteriorum TaxID=3024215 RepID=A0ABT6CKJ1_9SPHN|nr:DUF4136 domain-containing protein [Novosphingobium cyanobacteriorum]MDF8332867.1 DUF4136 domain-containing protein [Novosphingobium cyanobacteriorum]
MRHCLIALALLSTPAFAKPVEVTRFHTPETLASVRTGAAAVVPAAGMDSQSLETGTWLSAVQKEVALLGFGESTPGAADRVVEVRVERETLTSERTRNPVSVGVGGSTGGWNSGVGLGLGFSFGGGPKQRTYTRLSVTIRDRLSGKALWEGRAENTESAKDARASVQQAAPRLAHALFAGFPGRSGETIVVK